MFAVTTLEDPLDIPMNLLYPIDKSISYKPLTGTSNCLDYAQRAADGGIAVTGTTENGPVRANWKGTDSHSRRDVSARYSRACMMVHGMSAFVRMKLGGTAEVKAPVLW